MTDIYSDTAANVDTASLSDAVGNENVVDDGAGPQARLSLDADGTDALSVAISNNRTDFESPAQNVSGQQTASTAVHDQPQASIKALAISSQNASLTGSAASNLDTDTDDEIDEYEVDIDDDWFGDDDDDEPDFHVPAQQDGRRQDLRAPDQIAYQRSNAEIAELVGAGMGGSLFGGMIGAAIGLAIFSWTGPGALGGAVLGASIGATLFGGGGAAAVSHRVSLDKYGGKPQGHVLDMHMKALAKEGESNPNCRYLADERAALHHISDKTMRRLLRLPTFQFFPPRSPIRRRQRALIQKAVVHLLLKHRGDELVAFAAKEALTGIANKGSRRDLELAVKDILHGNEDKVFEEPSSPSPRIVAQQHQRLSGQGDLTERQIKNLNKLSQKQWKELLTFPGDAKAYRNELALPLVAHVLDHGSLAAPVKIWSHDRTSVQGTTVEQLKDGLIAAARSATDTGDDMRLGALILKTARYDSNKPLKPPLPEASKLPLEHPDRGTLTRGDLTLESAFCQDLKARLGLTSEILSRPLDYAGPNPGERTIRDVLQQALENEADKGRDLETNADVATAALNAFQKGLREVHHVQMFTERHSDLNDVGSAITALEIERFYVDRLRQDDWDDDRDEWSMSSLSSYSFEYD